LSEASETGTSENKARQMRRIIFSTIKILITLALLYAALRKTNFSDLASRIDGRSLSWLGVAIAIALIQVIVGAVRWSQISEYCRAPLALAQTVRFNMIGTFFNQTLPSSIGGDAMRLWLVGRTGVGWRAAAYSIFVDRTTGLIGLAMMIAASLPWSLPLITNPTGRHVLLFVDIAALAGGSVFLVLGLLPWLRGWRIVHHIRNCSEIAIQSLFNRRNGLQIVVLSLLVHFLSVIVAWCVVQAILASASFSQIFLLLPPVILITMAPISIAGWGVRETTMGLAFGYAGMATSEGINVSLLYGIIYLIVGACGGLIWIGSAERRQGYTLPND
jgi:uncharacterized membrane protein YbhN (UPF0104 family)